MDRNIEKKERNFEGKLQYIFERTKEIPEFFHSRKVLDAARVFTVFSFSFLVSSASLMSGVYPFGIALICAAGRFETAVAALAGALASLFFTGENLLLNGATLLSVFFVRLALGTLGMVKTYKVKGYSAFCSVRDSPSIEIDRGGHQIKKAFSTSAVVKMICALGGAVTMGAGMILIEGNLWYDVVASVFTAVTVPVFTFAFSAVSDEKYKTGLRKAGAASIAFAFFMAIRHFTLGGMNVGVVLAFLISMWASIGFGISDGILFGLFSGMAMEPAFAPMYAIAAAVNGALYYFSPGIASVCAAALGISWALYADGIAAFSSAMPEILLAAGIFYPLAYFRLLPEKVEFFEKKETEELHKEESFCKKKERDAAEKLKRISGAMSHISKVLSSLAKRLKVPSATDCDGICEAAFCEICTSCSKRKLCHARENFRDGRVLRTVSDSLKQQGRVGLYAFPETMRKGCPFLEDVAAVINREYGKFYAEVLKTDKTRVIAEDYENLAALIKETVCAVDPEEELNPDLTESIEEVFRKNGIAGEKISVYGKDRPKIFVRGLTVKDLSLGSEDIKKLADECVGASMTEPEMSVDYDRLNLYMECAKNFSFKYGHYSERAGGPEVNGDAVCSFVLPDGKYCMLICDGMGSGRDAALTARVSAIFLERMLTAGCPVGTALKLLNNFTSERRIECFSTVDLFIADPYTGKADFIKSGAAPSFVLRGNKLFKMECQGAPVGILKEVNAGMVSFSLEKGDNVVMISDGVLQDEENSAWLYDILCTPGRLLSSPSAAAKEILSAARNYYSECRPDDATVGIVRCA